MSRPLLSSILGPAFFEPFTKAQERLIEALRMISQLASWLEILFFLVLAGLLA